MITKVLHIDSSYRTSQHIGEQEYDKFWISTCMHREATDIASDSKKLKQEDAPQVLPCFTHLSTKDLLAFRDTHRTTLWAIAFAFSNQHSPETMEALCTNKRLYKALQISVIHLKRGEGRRDRKEFSELCTDPELDYAWKECSIVLTLECLPQQGAILWECSWKYSFVQAPVLPRQTSVDSRDSNKVKQKAAPVEVDDTAMFERKKPPTIDSLSQIKKVGYLAHCSHTWVQVDLLTVVRQFQIG